MNLFNIEPSRRLASGLALIAATVSGAAWPQASNGANTAPIVVAQASGTSQAQTGTATQSDYIPVNQRGARAAALEGPDALRRYVFRTRMIYNYSYFEFAPKEFADIVGWLALNHGVLDVFVHPNTDDELRDHRDCAIWLGHSHQLNLAALRD